jgi:alpha-L-rhamnosidase
MISLSMLFSAYAWVGCGSLWVVAACLAGSVALAAPQREPTGGLTPAELRCEYRVNPLGIDVVEPRLSWIVRSDERGQKQTAYQILVASSAKTLNLPEGKVDLWDSGQVQSDETTAIGYAGKRLDSDARCYWKVRVWDKEGKPSAWSAPATWSMGLLNPSDWKAEWIGYDKPHDAAITQAQSDKTKLILPPPSYFRTTFHLNKSVARATVYTTALGIHDIHLNGQRITEDYFNPGWTDYAKRVYYRAYDVTDKVHPGANALGAILADGWYSGYVGYGKMRHHYGQKTRLKAQINLVYADGTTEVIATGPAWKAAVGPILEADFLMGETYDARREMHGWDMAGFDDQKWDPVAIGAELKPLIQAHPGPPVRRFAELQGKEWNEPKPGVFVLDLGQNFAGVPRLRIHGDPGQKITLRFAERLNPDRTIYTTNLRSARCIDTYICDGKGEETWSPRFTFHGFQYVEVTGLKSPPTSETVVGLALSSDTPVAGRFHCSEPMLDKLQSNGYWTQRANFIDIPTDCPQRDERLGWTGDAQVYIRAASLNCDVQAFFTKWLVDLADGQRPDGQFPMVAPVKVAGDDGGPAWADAGVICPWTIYQVYGDRRLLERQYPSMVRFVEFCRKRCTPELLPPAQFHCFGDWLSIGADTPKDVIFTAYFAHSTRLTAAAASALGKEDASGLDQLYAQIKSAFNKAYVASDGRIKGNTQAVYVLALAFGLVDGERASQAANHLVDDIDGHNGHLTTGFVGTKDLMLVLSRIGRFDVAYRLLENDTFPSWGFSIKHGATSIWERWDGWTPERGFQDPGMNSFAHYSFGAVYQWMVENIGGIRSDGPGYKRIVIEPHPGGRLTHAETSYQSIRGEIATAWEKRDGKLSLEVRIPANTTAAVILPASRPEDVTESGRPVSLAAGVRVESSVPDRAAFEVGSGRYAFVAKTQ